MTTPNVLDITDRIRPVCPDCGRHLGRFTGAVSQDVCTCGYHTPCPDGCPECEYQERRK